MEEQQNVTRMVLDGREVILVGTAHVSRQSAELVEQVIAEERPDVVALELCAERMRRLSDPESWKRTDIVQVLREGRMISLLINLYLGAYQKKMAAKAGVRPGEEMLRALASAAASGTRVEPIDRDVRVTLARVWGYMGVQTKAALLLGGLGWPVVLGFAALIVLIILRKTELSPLTGNWHYLGVALCLLPIFWQREETTPEATPEDVEKLKGADQLQAALDEIGAQLPEIKLRLIDERDRYMVEKLRRCGGSKVVAVVGAAHVPGMQRVWQEQVDLAELESEPRSGWLARSWKWLIPGLLVAGFVIGLCYADVEKMKSQALIFCLLTGGCAALGSALAVAHPLSILTALVGAPLTVIHPALGIGMFTGFVEAYFRKPTVADFERLQEESSYVMGWYRNRILRVLLVFILSSLGAVAGLYTFLAYWVGS